MSRTLPKLCDNKTKEEELYEDIIHELLERKYFVEEDLWDIRLAMIENNMSPKHMYIGEEDDDDELY